VAGYLFVAPSLIHFLVFVAGCVVFSLVLSTMKWDLLTPPSFIGIRNYTELFHDKILWISLKNTLLYVLFTIPSGIALALALAIALNNKLRGVALFRTAYFIPVVSSMVAVSIVWRWIFNPDFGLLNWFLGLFGVPAVDWLGNKSTALLSVAIVSVWKGLGWNMILFLAGLQSIPTHLYEAAEIDGANGWHKFAKITWPLLSPTTFLVVVMAIIDSFQVFDSVYQMTKGGPELSTTVYNFYLYNNAFRYFNMGYASAMAWILFVIIAFLTWLQFRFLNKRVQYELG